MYFGRKVVVLIGETKTINGNVKRTNYQRRAGRASAAGRKTQRFFALARKATILVVHYGEE
ncbi:hypothetical protein, partial [Bacillus subtilis]|uniref:hypothetical protein n=1 Tax=Bacillus subtilis TaxID=1423 RepID=UPI00202A9EB6